jgi:hypothetical protein
MMRGSSFVDVLLDCNQPDDEDTATSSGSETVQEERFA